MHLHGSERGGVDYLKLTGEESFFGGVDDTYFPSAVATRNCAVKNDNVMLLIMRLTNCLTSLHEHQVST